MDTDDLEPQTKKPEPIDLDAMSVEELESYLVELLAEAERVRAKVASKKEYLTGANTFFKT